ncbi:hypothetical protein F2P47_11700 [Parvibaculum sedimenti]|uniref:Uncharacterized protein n=1 Tax=Parvibaculum sedimenti TaxID=2608632 RepID=A0A6N6VHB1_9HYPH|nr:dienelactone hydrolase family protein [Parvibaculum sedimenti]KAB7739728.1 hypothetical protein F2P47_11700 [Parvibaculum sedimenti]
MSGHSARSTTHGTVCIPPFGLPGSLDIPAGAKGIILFAHGSGSSRLSPRNNYVGKALRDGGLGTLLFDLLTEEEEAVRAHVFDIELLAGRLSTAAEWLVAEPVAAGLSLGLFGASTGAAAALVAAARADIYGAIVSRGGRPDLAGEALSLVTAPTLLIVGGNDRDVLALNREALAQLRCTKELAIVPGATHLFEEPGALDQVIELARDWFLLHLPQAGKRA